MQRPIREHMNESYKELWGAVEQTGLCDWTLNSEEAASVTGPGGIHCHGDLVHGCCGDADERRHSGEQQFWVVAWPIAYSTMCPADRGDYVHGCCNVVCAHVCFCVCDCIHVCFTAVYLERFSMFSDHEMSDSLAPRWWSLCCLRSSPEELLTPQPPTYLITTPHSPTARSEVCVYMCT